jgi:hypothetical protein
MLRQVLLGAAILALAPAAQSFAQETHPISGTPTAEGSQDVQRLKALMAIVPGGEAADPYRALADAFGRAALKGSAVGEAKAVTLGGASSPDFTANFDLAKRTMRPAPLAPGSAEIP